MRTGPSPADGGVGRSLPFHDKSDNIGADGSFRKGFDDMRQKLQGMRLVVLGQFEQPALLKCIQDGIHDPFPPKRLKNQVFTLCVSTAYVSRKAAIQAQ